MSKKTLPIVILILIVIVCIAILVQSLSAPVQAPSQASTAPSLVSPATIAGPAHIITSQDRLIVERIYAPGGSIEAEVASTSDQQAKGLGGRASLKAGTGMLFPFAHPGDYGFWMKDMHFPLDMVWISSNKKVASVTSNISPDTYPEVFYPPLAISYVLELNAGDAVRFGIATGTELEF